MFHGISSLLRISFGSRLTFLSFKSAFCRNKRARAEKQKPDSVCLAFTSPYQIVASETVSDLFNLVCFEIPTIFFCTNWILMESSTCGNLLHDSSLYFIYVLVVSWKSSLTYSSKNSFRILRNAEHILHITSM